MIASAARRADSAPIPPHTSTAPSFSKNRNRRPDTSFSTARHPLTSGRTSRSSAATMAILDIAIGPKPLDRPPQRIVNGNHFPPQFALRFVRTSKHLLLAHSYRIHGGARLTMQHPARNSFVNYPGGQCEKIWQLHFGRGQAGNLAELVENLF